MTRKQQRLTLILSGLAVLGLAAGLVLYALRDTIVFFYTPSEIADKHIGSGQRIRLGGLVANGSLVRGTGTTASNSASCRWATGQTRGPSPRRFDARRS
jgi:cytochrome c-type biogenesis protein CcmE